MHILHLNKKMFQKIQWTWKCFLKVNLFESKLEIPRKDPDNIRNALKLN
jgi:hypothetical protein